MTTGTIFQGWARGAVGDVEAEDGTTGEARHRSGACLLVTRGSLWALGRACATPADGGSENLMNVTALRSVTSGGSSAGAYKLTI